MEGPKMSVDPKKVAIDAEYQAALAKLSATHDRKMAEGAANQKKSTVLEDAKKPAPKLSRQAVDARGHARHIEMSQPPGDRD